MTKAEKSLLRKFFQLNTKLRVAKWDCPSMVPEIEAQIRAIRRKLSAIE